MKRVLVNGANGRMGEATVEAIRADSDLDFVLGLGRKDDLKVVLKKHQVDMVVDFTIPDGLYERLVLMLQSGVDVLVGTTGLTEKQMKDLHDLACSNQCRIAVCPNFCIGAVLMMMFSEKAAGYFKRVEILEYHHDRKKDAPSGTAIKTADVIASTGFKAEALDETELLSGARGCVHRGIPIHAIRIPGVIANQDVVFGGDDEVLTFKHQTLSRTSFMPGVILAIKALDSESPGLIYGLERFLY